VQLCERVKTYRTEVSKLPGFKNVRCATNALGAAGSVDNTTPELMRTACSKEFERCMETGPTLPPIDCHERPGTSFVPTMAEQLGGCPQITADELFACQNEMRDAMIQVGGTDPCALPLDPKDPLASYHAYLDKFAGPKCVAIKAKCKP